jgi:hypothetical protein
MLHCARNSLIEMGLIEYWMGLVVGRPDSVLARTSALWALAQRGAA